MWAADASLRSTARGLSNTPASCIPFPIRKDPRPASRSGQLKVSYPPLAILANHKKRAPTRLRLLMDDGGIPSALELDSPGVAVTQAILRLQQPAKFAVDLVVVPKVDGHLPLERVRIEKGQLTGFVHREVHTVIAFGKCAEWSMPGRRVQFTIALPAMGHDTSPCASIVFRDNLNAQPSALDDARFDGLRIAGVDSIARAREVLDASGVAAQVLLYGGALDAQRPYVQLTCDWLGPRLGQHSHDARAGVLDMPVEDTLLQVTRHNARSPLVYHLALGRTGAAWTGDLQIVSACLLVPPFGGSASEQDGHAGPDWSRCVRMVPKLSARINAFQSSAAPRLQLVADWSTQWLLDGEQGLMLHDMANLGTRFEAMSLASATTPKVKAAADEGVAYAALALALSYIAGAYEGQGWTKFFETELKLKFKEDDLKQWADRNNIKDVLVTLDDLPGSNAQQSWFRRFVFDNIKKPGAGPQPAGVLWPFAPGLGIPIYEGASPDSATWLWDMQRNGDTLTCGYAFDYSPITCVDLEKLGLPDDFFDCEPTLRPALWPRSRKQAAGMMPGAIDDPACPAWSGIFVRDVPLALPDIPGGAEFFQSLREKINQGLKLDYGWLDNFGHTWVATWSGAAEPVRVFPFSTADKPPVEILLEGFSTEGAQGQTISSALQLKLILHAIKDDKNEPVQLVGKGQFAAISGQKSYFELQPGAGSHIVRGSLPGFKTLKFKRFRTDFTSASLELGLIASDALREAIPFFDQEDGVVASMSIALDGKGESTLALRLPADARTTLFGKWPIAIRALEFTLGSANRTRILFALDLGIAGISAVPRVGGTLTLSVSNDNLNFDLALDSGIDVDLSAFGVGVAGSLYWRDPGHKATDLDHPPVPVPLSDAAKRDFYGAVRLKGLASTDDAALYLRIGAQGRPFWVAALLAAEGKAPKLAQKEVKNSGFLLAYGAQQGAGDALRDALSRPENKLPDTLFPKPGGDPIAWLDTWKRATDGLGLAVGISGNYTLQDFLAAAPDGKHNLSVLWADTGLFYASANLKLFGLQPTEFHLLVDFAKSLLSAGLQVDGISLENSVKVAAGYMSLTVAWGSGRSGFGFSLGYPPISNNNELGLPAPAWSKAVSVQLKEAWPINTFQGGLKAWYFNNPTDYGFGISLRAGYSNSWKVTGNSIADARADIGVMVGGSVLFCGLAAPAAKPLSLFSDMTALSSDARWLTATVDEFLKSRMRDTMLISASVFGDVWGHASVIFMGVTIAGVKLDARAAFDIRGEFGEGILYMGAEYSFRVSVKIGCSTFGTNCHFSLVMVDRGRSPAGDCNPFLAQLRQGLLANNAEQA